MTKKDPVLWVVVDKDGIAWGYAWMKKAYAVGYADNCSKQNSENAPFRVVKYLPAPKKRRTK